MRGRTIGSRRRRGLLLAGGVLIAVSSGCGEGGPIDQEALQEEMALPGSTVPMPTEAEWDDMEVGDVFTIPLNVHCGVGYLGLFDGPAWEATDVDSDFSERDLEYGGIVWGEVEVIEPDRLEFRHPRLSATFRPYEGEAEVLNCD